MHTAGRLVITRKVGQSFWVGDSFVTVVSLRGKQARVAIEAPRDVKVVRSELKEGKK